MRESDMQQIRLLLRDFYNLTGIKTCLYDNEENELCFYPQKLTEFCAILREDEEMAARCKNCDKQAFATCRKMNRQYAYTCHAGLRECVSPIRYENAIIGFILLGQIKSDETVDFTEIEDKFPAQLRERLKRAYADLPVIPFEKLASAARILDACAGYEHLKNTVKNTLENNENKIDNLLERYVRNNLAQPLSVTLLCSRFHLSHSEIYAIFKEYFDATPAEYIKKSRLSYACKLLRETALPVNKIAVQCGIPDYNYFSKVFKRDYGVSPREYRANKPFAPL